MWFGGVLSTDVSEELVQVHGSVANFIERPTRAMHAEHDSDTIKIFLPNHQRGCPSRKINKALLEANQPDSSTAFLVFLTKTGTAQLNRTPPAEIII